VTFPTWSTGDPITGRLILTVLAGIAEFEARRIGQRIREAFAVKRARGDRMGSRDPRCQHMTDEHRRAGSAAGVAVKQRLAAEFRTQLQPVALDLRNQGLNNRQVADHLNGAGHTTRRGRPWTLFTVSALLNGET
jgi:DNA invertase Pin-like site-specific DNA recombinase